MDKFAAAADRQHKRWLTIFALFVASFFYAFFNWYPHYVRHYAELEVELEERRAYLREDICQNPESKARVGRFNMCNEARVFVARGLNRLALERTYNDIRFCPPDQPCTLLGINITEQLEMITRYALYLGVLFGALVLWNLIQAAAARTISYGTLPTTNPNGRFIQAHEHVD